MIMWELILRKKNQIERRGKAKVIHAPWLRFLVNFNNLNYSNVEK